MERIPTYRKLDDNRVERTRTVKDTIMLRGSNASLEMQIKMIEAEIAVIDITDYATKLQDMKDRDAARKAEQKDLLAFLKAKWKAATGKDYPES